MQIRTIAAFLAPGSPRSFTPGEYLTIPDKLASRWIADGKAVPLVNSSATPTKRIREKATRF